MSNVTREVFETVSKVLLRCWVIGFVLQLVTFVAYLLASELVADIYGSMFGLSNHETALIVVSYIALMKLLVVGIFFIPWLAIWSVLKSTKPVVTC